jgi:isoleucyl-tRNA synthetase
VSEFRIRAVGDDASPSSSERTLSQFESEDPADLMARSEWSAEETIEGHSVGDQVVDKQGGAWLKHGAKVVVHSPSGGKCPRCWRFVKEEKEDVCGRCEHVMKQEGVEVPV